MLEVVKKTKQKRSRLETIHVILTLSVEGIKKTHIMYRANLSHLQLEKYLEVLVSKQFLEKKNEFYVTTSLGLAFIEKFKEIQSLMGENNPINLSWRSTIS